MLIFSFEFRGKCYGLTIRRLIQCDIMVGIFHQFLTHSYLATLGDLLFSHLPNTSCIYDPNIDPLNRTIMCFGFKYLNISFITYS